MDRLRKIWHHQLFASDSFSKLKELRVTGCGELTNIFPSNIITERRLERLENLVVVECGSIEEIIEQSSSTASRRRFDVFPSLTSLELWLLRKLVSVYQGIHVLEWPVLGHLKVVECDKVEILFASSELLSGETQSQQQPLFFIHHPKV